MYHPHRRCRAARPLVLIACIAAASCAGTAPPGPEAPVPTDPQTVRSADPVAVPALPPPSGGAAFDPSSVSVELKQTTFFDVRALISGLNSIIQAKDYESWSSALTQDYKANYSSPETLARISDAPVLKRQGIVLRSLQDYFIHVVYPSRQNDRVDDIEFIDATHIRAITINAKGERLVLYNLEKIGDTWKIAIWR